jgi:ATP-binding cassette subfamily F protein uup
MSLLALKSGCLAYGHVALLDHADLQLEPGERVALIGRNGTGKSSLLRTLAGTAALDDGEVWRKSGLRLAQVEQEPDFEPGLTVFDALIAGLGEATRSLHQYHLVSQRLAEPGADHDSLLAELGRLQS